MVLLAWTASWAEDPGVPPGAAPFYYKLLIILVVIGLLWLLLRPHYRFVIEVNQGQARLRRGQATAAFVREVEEVFRELRLDHGSVMGLALGKQVVLRFSRQVPAGGRQRIRNLHRLHG